MEIIKTVVIDRTADEAWHIVAEEFDQAYKWMSFVHHSHKVDSDDTANGAPVAGRVCEFTDNPDGLKAIEKILSYSPENKQFVFDVVPVNAPRIFPVHKNIVTMSVTALGNDKAEVSWTSNIELTAFGYILYPFLKFGLSKQFGQVLADLQTYANKTPAAAAA
ncbi:SRPBCC family protein [Kordiimonas laminariae]|uniref:SRPBCC family protein n=1 Tax=Kordiimonas laminariae TaxID=2917717 RepID=UPI001FF13E06|nr:SRPBCC family protein [Kordiimonas laminariae]MCK0068170.1 SRPBCC family protein [Kordiimonas laminariae]